MEEIIMVNIKKKKGWLSLYSTTSAAVFSVESCMIVIMILLGGINPLCASSYLQIMDMVDKNTNMSSKTDINNTGRYTNANNTQDWKDPENNLRIQFIYLPEYPLAGNITKLIFQFIYDFALGITINLRSTTLPSDSCPASHFFERCCDYDG
jgi:hypothetical protein